MNIILIGFMGAGKSTIAKKLAEKLSFKNIDMDKIIVEKSGRKSAAEIFEKDGELAFREYEILVANELKDEQNFVISTGGGIVMNKVNIDYLKKNGVIVFLQNTFETSKKRINKHNPPPLFKDLNQAQQLYDLRLPLYTFYADVVIETDDITLQEVTDKIISKIKHL